MKGIKEMRHITVPSDVVLVHPHTSEPLLQDNGNPEAPVSFKRFLSSLLSNPMWIESYDNLKSAKVIEDAIKTMNGTLSLPNDEWARLEVAAKHPRMVIVSAAGPTIVSGYGFHPQVSAQLLPLVEAVVNATLSEDKN
jgi:hypothetical protein